MTGFSTAIREHGEQTLVLQMVPSVPLAGWETGSGLSWALFY